MCTAVSALPTRPPGRPCWLPARPRRPARYVFENPDPAGWLRKGRGHCLVLKPASKQRIDEAEDLAEVAREYEAQLKNNRCSDGQAGGGLEEVRPGGGGVRGAEEDNRWVVARGGLGWLCVDAGKRSAKGFLHGSNSVCASVRRRGEEWEVWVGAWPSLHLPGAPCLPPFLPPCLATPDPLPLTRSPRQTPRRVAAAGT